MHILIIDYSTIVRKRVLPALRKIELVDCIDIACRSSAPGISDEAPFSGTVFNNYDDAILKSKADLVYVSLVNSCHAEWAEKALLKGCHVIVDKPSFTSIDDARRLADLACAKNLCLAEATVYAWHPQIQMARDLFLQAGTRLTRLTVSFSFPPFPADNFRYQKHLGGGALWDLGPYAVSPGRLFFKDEPEEVFCRVCTRSAATEVDTSFSMLATYPGGRSMIGHFDFNTEYRNCINILGPGMSVDIDRVFTTPPDMENELLVRSNNRTAKVKTPQTDSFAIFLQRVFNAINKNDYSTFIQDLLSDATLLSRLRKAAKEE
jgi:dTDP-3,4-didehydro-2,6-dideoxy-alpha-D-glucose 3-reductase